MRRILLPLALALLSLAFAPAPFPKGDRPDRAARETPQQKQDRLLRECRRRLDDLGVKWHLQDQGQGGRVRFTVNRPNGGGMGGSLSVTRGDLPGTLRRLIGMVEDFFKNDARL